jgi:hypothetical protein
MALPKVRLAVLVKGEDLLIVALELQRIIKVIISPATRHRPLIFCSQETERLVADPAPGISATPHEDNLRYFDVIIEGPGGSPFQSERRP